MKSPVIKVCGLTRPEDALLAIEAGANYLGLIFVPNTPRCVSPEQARVIRDTIGQRAKLVGVFQDASLDTIQQVYSEVGLDLIQLHGSEPDTMIDACPAPVIRVVTVGATQVQSDWHGSFTSHNLHALLFDLPKGSEITWEDVHWTRPKDTGLPPVWLAGKLTAETIDLALNRFEPDGVDVASGVESGPGVKDPQKLLAFCHAVRHHGQHVLNTQSGEQG